MLKQVWHQGAQASMNNALPLARAVASALGKSSAMKWTGSAPPSAADEGGAAPGIERSPTDARGAGLAFEARVCSLRAQLTSRRKLANAAHALMREV
jgi:hypothetical protein